MNLFLIWKQISQITSAFSSLLNVVVTIKAELQIQILSLHIDTFERIVNCDDINMTTALKMMTKTKTKTRATKTATTTKTMTSALVTENITIKTVLLSKKIIRKQFIFTIILNTLVLWYIYYSVLSNNNFKSIHITDNELLFKMMPLFNRKHTTVKRNFFLF